MLRVNVNVLPCGSTPTPVDPHHNHAARSIWEHAWACLWGLSLGHRQAIGWPPGPYRSRKQQVLSVNVRQAGSGVAPPVLPSQISAAKPIRPDLSEILLRRIPRRWDSVRRPAGRNGPAALNAPRVNVGSSSQTHRCLISKVVPRNQRAPLPIERHRRGILRIRQHAHRQPVGGPAERQGSGRGEMLGEGVVACVVQVAIVGPGHERAACAVGDRMKADHPARVAAQRDAQRSPQLGCSGNGRQAGANQERRGEEDPRAAARIAGRGGPPRGRQMVWGEQHGSGPHSR